MTMQPSSQPLKRPGTSIGAQDVQLPFVSEILKRPVCTGKITDRIGQVTDLVFRLTDPYPEAMGIYVEHGWGKPTEFVPWDRVQRIEDDAVFVTPAEGGGTYPPFVDQPGWILVNEHLMGRTILDMDGRRIEVVNDVHLMASKGKAIIIHVDVSFNGFLRRWGIPRLLRLKDQLISWRYVQPLSLEDVGAKDSVSLSITRKQLMELPSEDLADALEELSGQEQQAFFSALDSETAAEALSEAEPRAQRQLIANLRRERARTILSEMSIPQLADLFSVLPHHDFTKMMELLPAEEADRIQTIISEREVTARVLMSEDYVAVGKDATVEQVLHDIRVSGREPDNVSYIYVVLPDTGILLGVVDLRELVLAPDTAAVGNLMASPAVSAQEDDTREDLVELFTKYHYRMLPVVDVHDRMLGAIRYKDIMKGVVARVRT